MKPYITLIIGALLGAQVVAFFYNRKKPTPPVPQQLTLEKILSIKELHLVRHTYHDLFFLHRHNNKRRAIRAMVQVPVVVTAYLDLKDMEFIRAHDTIKQIVLPRARLHTPDYQVAHMVVRETRGLQVHVGKDQYAQVSQYLQVAIAERMDSIRHMAVVNRILIQAEEEGREYIQKLLLQMGRADIVVRFTDEKDIPKPVASPANNTQPRYQAQLMEAIPYGFVPFGNN